MRKSTEARDLAYTMFDEAARRGLMYHEAQDASLDGRHFQSRDQLLLNFANCSYLGLEMDPRLKAAAIAAIEKYGTQFSSSRAAVSAPPYHELEALLGELFGAPTLVTPSTSLGHLSALPVLIEEGDAIILDQQVHHSVNTAVQQVRAYGVRVEVVRHNDISMIETWIKRLRAKHRRIWYMADGLYSMYGDFAPMAELKALLTRYECLHLYVDDAHAMSWTGRHGRGHALETIAGHERAVVATSLNKAFAAGGGALVVPDDHWRRKIRVIGGPMVFSGPVQPASLGAAIASAQLHLSSEMPQLQAELMERIQLCNRWLVERGLPVLDPCDSPIRFIGCGLPRVAYNLVARLMDEGFFVNGAFFPLVPMRRAGIRFTLTRLHTVDDIRRFVDRVAHHLPLALEEEGSDMAEVRHVFRLPSPSTPAELPVAPLELRVPAAQATEGLRLQHETSIESLDAAEWDRLLGDRGSFSWNGLRFLEQTFHPGRPVENAWKFHYYVVRDAQGTPILATFFTEALWKDDMLASEATSRLVEERRRESPHFLSSRTFAMGSLLTEGDHLYLDRQGDWRGALTLLLKAVTREAEQAEAASIVLRDLSAGDSEVGGFLQEAGFAQVAMPDSHQVTLDWEAPEDFLRQLSKNARRHQRLNVLPYVQDYTVKAINAGDPELTAEELAHLYTLYLNVKARGFLINTFTLPEDLFERMIEHPEWEVMLLYHRDHPERPVGVSGAYRGGSHYVPLVIGLDYDYVHEAGAYRAFMYHVVMHAKADGTRRIDFGMGADLEKRRFGATAQARYAYVQAFDHFHQDVLTQFAAAATKRS